MPLAIWGVDLQVVSPCRCGCASLRVHPHSTKSDILIWKCAWCGIRKGKLTETEIKALESFVRLFGWPVLPLTFNDDGYVYGYGQLSKMRQAPARVRWKDGGVSTVQAGYSTNNVVCLPRKGGSVVPGIEVTLRSKRVASLIGQHDEYLKKRGWYDVITATLDENWLDDAVDGFLTGNDTD
jgi:hypothetical protein